MNSEEKKLYDQGLKELAKYYYYKRKGTKGIRGNIVIPTRIREIHERMINMFYDQNDCMTDLGKVIYVSSLLAYLFYFIAFLQATNITSVFALFIYLIGSIGGSWLISTKIFQLEEEDALKISGIISFIFPFLLLIGMFVFPPLHNYFNSVSSTIAHFLK